MTNPYLPKLPGLTAVDEIQFSLDTHEDDATAVWRDDTTGQLYYADDACCCRATFDDFIRGDLAACTADELQAHLDKRLANDFVGDDKTRAETAAEVAALMARIRAL